MIIQLLADGGLLANGQSKIVVSVDPAKPLAQAIPNILSKVTLTKRENFLLYFTTHSTCLEQGLGRGDREWSEATSSTGGLTSSDAASAFSGAAESAAKGDRVRRMVAESRSTGKVLPLPIVVDWNRTPSQLGMRPHGCHLWIKRISKQPDHVEVAPACDPEELAKVLEPLERYNPSSPFDFIAPLATSDAVPYTFVAKKDLAPGQVLFREALHVVESYPHSLVDTVATNAMLSRNLPYDAAFTEASPVAAHTDGSWSKALSQAMMNGVAVGDDMGFAPWLSVFTRACWPNAMSFLSPDHKTVDIVAIDHIARGDEVVLPWEVLVDQFWLPDSRRAEWVEGRFGQPCKCGRCLLPSDEDKALSGAFMVSRNNLAVQVMHAEYNAALESSDKHKMLSFLQKYTKAEGGDAGRGAAPLQLHKHHWRLADMRSRLLLWYVAHRKRTDNRLPVVLLDQMEMNASVMPKYYPPKLRPYRQWRELLARQPQHVRVLLKRMAAERKRVDWAALSQLEALEERWNQARAIEVPPIPITPPLTSSSESEQA